MYRYIMGHHLRLSLERHQDHGKSKPARFPFRCGRAYTLVCVVDDCIVLFSLQVVYFTVIFPFIMLFILLIRGLSLPGSMTGVLFYITPHWDKLLDVKVRRGLEQTKRRSFFTVIFRRCGGMRQCRSSSPWGQAGEDSSRWPASIHFATTSDGSFRFPCFLTASLGGLHGDGDDHVRECAIIPLTNCLTSLFAGFVVFSVLGFMSLQTGKPVSEVATAGKSISFPLFASTSSKSGRRKRRWS